MHTQNRLNFIATILWLCMTTDINYVVNEEINFHSKKMLEPGINIIMHNQNFCNIFSKKKWFLKIHCKLFYYRLFLDLNFGNFNV
jgi:hypothetical protein